MSTLARPVGRIGWLITLAVAGALAWGLWQLLTTDQRVHAAREELIGLGIRAVAPGEAIRARACGV